MKIALQAAAAGAWSALFLGLGVAVAPMAIRSDGVQFPDGTLQTTAAAAAVEALPQHCFHASTLAASETLVLTCYSFLPGGGGWGASGVPAGKYFVVTDVMFHPVTTSDTGDVVFSLRHSYECETGTPSNRTSRDFRVVPNMQTTVWSFRAPALILIPGDCLRVLGGNGMTAAIVVSINGYLTANPELLGT